MYFVKMSMCYQSQPLILTLLLLLSGSSLAKRVWLFKSQSLLLIHITKRATLPISQSIVDTIPRTKISSFGQ
ncbi:hypothetical protein IWW34DRAFT_765536 [Fusarium oxysporum f. sp. albedinis]|nr:hypothetical protein IWW34DRAFT_765536 [Fusarium oxysporum f. sp. albedinis]